MSPHQNWMLLQMHLHIPRLNICSAWHLSCPVHAWVLLGWGNLETQDDVFPTLFPSKWPAQCLTCSRNLVIFSLNWTSLFWFFFYIQLFPVLGMTAKANVSLLHKWKTANLHWGEQKFPQGCFSSSTSGKPYFLTKYYSPMWWKNQRAGAGLCGGQTFVIMTLHKSKGLFQPL